MAKANLQINLEYLVARSLLAVLGFLPLRVALFVGSITARAAYHFSGRLRRTGERNLELAFPDLSRVERRRLLRGCFENLGRLLGVFSHFRDEPADRLRQMIQCVGIERADPAFRDKRGVIFFTGHAGAWELSSFGLSLYGYPFSFLVRRIDNPKIEALVDRFRTCRGNRTIDKRSAAREMLQILRGGGALGILVDLNALDREAIFVDFFGVKAATTFIVAKLALRTDALVIPIFSPWDKTLQRFTVKIGEPLSFDRTEDEEEDTRRVTQLLTKAVEDCVRSYPDQWLWIHRRWKTRPRGEPEIYD